MPLCRNILIFNHSYSTQFVDISNQYARLFPSGECEVTVVYLTGKPDEEVKAKTQAKNVIFLDCPPRVTRGLKIPVIRQMAQLTREKAFEVVICHRYKPTYIMLWVAQFYRIPHFISIMHELGTMRNLGRKLIIACLAPKNMIFAGVSNAVRNDMRQDIWRIPPGRVITLYNMIDVDYTLDRLLSREEARERLNLAQEAFIFGTVGRLAKNKDQKTLIEAFARLMGVGGGASFAGGHGPRGPCPPVKLVILGDGQLEHSLKQQVQNLGLGDHVIFTGFIPDGFRYMKAFDTYVSSSIQEAFGRVLLEAMIARVPTIATRVNGMPEVLGDTGLLVNPRDPEQLAEAMREAYQMSSQKRLVWGESGYQRATKDFSIPRFCEVMNQILLPDWIRTNDTVVNSHLLYQLSYRGKVYRVDTNIVLAERQ